MVTGFFATHSPRFQIAGKGKFKLRSRSSPLLNSVLPGAQLRTDRDNRNAKTESVLPGAIVMKYVNGPAKYSIASNIVIPFNRCSSDHGIFLLVTRITEFNVRCRYFESCESGEAIAASSRSWKL